jgi:pantetheine-phosphate adenylyltransferase
MRSRNAGRTKARGAVRRALYPGSFDPPTRGHLDVIERAAKLFDHVTVGVVANPAKSPIFSPAERVDLIRREIRRLGNVDVVAFSGLTVALAARLGARWLVRGLRSSADLDGELAMAHTNRAASAPPVETVLVPARPEVSFISATFVREIASGGGRVDDLVTPDVASALRRKLARR